MVSLIWVLKAKVVLITSIRWKIDNFNSNTTTHISNCWLYTIHLRINISNFQWKQQQLEFNLHSLQLLHQPQLWKDSSQYSDQPTTEAIQNQSKLFANNCEDLCIQLYHTVEQLSPYTQPTTPSQNSQNMKSSEKCLEYTL